VFTVCSFFILSLGYQSIIETNETRFHWFTVGCLCFAVFIYFLETRVGHSLAAPQDRRHRISRATAQVFQARIHDLRLTDIPDAMLALHRVRTSLYMCALMRSLRIAPRVGI
jgi:hypothetical protein